MARRKSDLWLFLILVALIGAVVSQLNSSSNPKTAEIKADSEANADWATSMKAEHTCHDLVYATLKAPSTADFGGQDAGRERGTKTKWIAQGYVDAQNSFGRSSG
jgi:hypothetical protein